jgi:hypothetical protein
MLVSGRDHGALKLVVRSESGAPVVNAEAVARVKRWTEQGPIAMVGLDPLSKLHRARGSDNDDMNFVMESLASFARAARVAVLLPAHTSKPSSGARLAGNVDSALGAAAVRDNVRVAYTLGPPEDEDAERSKLTPAQRQLYLRLDDAKQNRALMSGQPVWMRKVTVGMPNGEKVGAFELADMRRLNDEARTWVATVLARYLTDKAVLQMTLLEAAEALRQSDGLYRMQTPAKVKTTIEGFLMDAVALDGGALLKLETDKNVKVVRLV